MADVKKFNNMFLVNAPAGSGKTTYIENTIINLLAKYPNRKILSITYTNRAKEELNSRIDSNNVTIDTIHSFLSSFVGGSGDTDRAFRSGEGLMSCQKAEAVGLFS